MSDLYSPVRLGNIELKNRIIMAPLTRSRAYPDHTPNTLMNEYYTQRASAGLIISEATMIKENNSSFIYEPGIYNQLQIDEWKKITDSVHEKGGKIVMQLWHGGRTCHPVLNRGLIPVAPSAIKITNTQVHTLEGKIDYTVPRELDVNEMTDIINMFSQAAINAKEAGFDGVEVHAANGYLLDQFLKTSSNKRTDLYGGSLENRSRLIFEVLNAVCLIWGGDRVGIRLSPINSFNSMYDDDPIELIKYLGERLNSYNLAYLHIMRSDFYKEINIDVMTPLREKYNGNLITNMSYTKDEAELGILNNDFEAVAFGALFIANPDLPYRLNESLELNEAKVETFYTQDKLGYTDYPFA